jgi:hypothetical protein
VADEPEFTIPDDLAALSAEAGSASWLGVANIAPRRAVPQRSPSADRVRFTAAQVAAHPAAGSMHVRVGPGSGRDHPAVSPPVRQHGVVLALDRRHDVGRDLDRADADPPVPTVAAVRVELLAALDTSGGPRRCRGSRTCARGPGGSPLSDDIEARLFATEL